MLLNYQYRAYPETNQKLTLNNWLRVARYWYNWQLGDRFDWWEKNRSAINSCRLICHTSDLRDNPTRYLQQGLLPGLKKDLLRVGHSGELLDFSLLPANTLQDVTKRADLAFQRFTRGDLNGNRSGKPRFKSAARYRTLGFTGSQIPKIVHVQKDWLFLTLPRFKGWLKVRCHRPLPDGFDISATLDVNSERSRRVEVRSALLTKKADG